ncbi:MAG TPA: hypothetical protein QF753_01715 [Victivallales bacterium]|nr:hypothetical protein [Victivallales bacterium]
MKNLCKLNSDYIKENIDELKELVKKPRYICKKCARASKDKNLLCKPLKLEKKKSND